MKGVTGDAHEEESSPVIREKQQNNARKPGKSHINRA
jgi:hypothetical protein